MNWDQFDGNWKQVKGKVKEQWGRLTGDELDRLNGRRDQLVGKIQERYGDERDRAEREIDEVQSRWGRSPFVIKYANDAAPALCLFAGHVGSERRAPDCSVSGPWVPFAGFAER